MFVAQDVDPPAVIVVVMDDIGNEYVNCYGEGPADHQPATPNMDRLAAMGMRFDNFWSMPVCSPTRAALLTGRWPNRYGLGTVIMEREGDPRYLSMAEVCVPEADPAHFHGHIGKWHLGSHYGSYDPILQGFDLRVGTLGNVKGYSNWIREIDWPGLLVSERQTQYVTEQITDNTLTLRGLLEDHRPYCLWVNHNAPHAPLHDPPGYQTDGSDLAQYKAMIEYLDSQLGRILATYDPGRDWLILLSDNGTEVDLATTTGAKGSVLEGGINVPLIVAGPGVPPGSVTQALANCVDLHATVLQMLGAPPSSAQDCVSLMPVLLDPNATVREINYAERFLEEDADNNGRWDLDLRAARDARYKLVWEEGEVSFHDLWTAGPGEDGAPNPPHSGEEQLSYDRLLAVVEARGR
jgi:arylsulfatase B